ncbi:hypothetical protein HNY73_007241 [Argiope bruennichi]|uniref:Uncharacterized protein n=1 Tax=Argiope bruennichi TaxID=94029 RepID=A0A8T0FDC5_ARGBR|nr:hypothetical protein HNY73_007241 [Argiope bruennichi]
MEYLSEEFRPHPDLDEVTYNDDNEVHFKFSIFQLMYQSNCIFYPEQLKPEETPTPWQLDLNCSRPLSKTDVMRLQFNLLRTDNQMYSVQVNMEIQVFNCVQIKIMEHSFQSMFTAPPTLFESRVRQFLHVVPQHSILNEICVARDTCHAFVLGIRPRYSDAKRPDVLICCTLQPSVLPLLSALLLAPRDFPMWRQRAAGSLCLRLINDDFF